MPQWKSLPTRCQSNFWLLLCSAHLSPSWFSLAQEGSSCFLANRSFLSTSHQRRASSLRQRYSVTRVSDWATTRLSCHRNLCGESCSWSWLLWGCQLIKGQWLAREKSLESHISKSLFDVGLLKGRIVKCSVLCRLQLRLKIFSDAVFYIMLPISSLTR